MAACRTCCGFFQAHSTARITRPNGAVLQVIFRNIAVGQAVKRDKEKTNKLAAAAAAELQLEFELSQARVALTKAREINNKLAAHGRRRGYVI